MMSKYACLLAAALCMFTTTNAMADALSGNWQRPNGVIVKFAPCGSAFCATALTGPNAGKAVGKLTGSADSGYRGSLSDPSAGKTYSGKASIAGTTLKVSGCVLGGLICRSENWQRK